MIIMSMKSSGGYVGGISMWIISVVPIVDALVYLDEHVQIDLDL
jgi:hypothetical protein